MRLQACNDWVRWRCRADTGSPSALIILAGNPDDWDRVMKVSRCLELAKINGARCPSDLSRNHLL